VELAVNGSQWPMSYGERKIVGTRKAVVAAAGGPVAGFFEWIVEAVHNYYSL
jgi:hypothetical protein